MPDWLKVVLIAAAALVLAASVREKQVCRPDPSGGYECRTAYEWTWW